MEKRWTFTCSGLIILIFCLGWAVQPVSPQVPQPGGEETTAAPIRVWIADLTVEGEQAPKAVREAFHGILPQVVACMEAEQERVQRLPRTIMARFNVASNGKVVWSKVVDPPLQSLGTCLSKTLQKLQLPPAGTKTTRVTVVLETRQDHLIAP